MLAFAAYIVSLVSSRVSPKGPLFVLSQSKPIRCIRNRTPDFRALHLSALDLCTRADAGAIRHSACATARRGVVSRAVARVQVGARPAADAGRAHERGPHRRVRVVLAGAFRRPLRPRLDGARHRARREASYRCRHRHAHRRAACVAHCEISRHAGHECRRPMAPAWRAAASSTTPARVTARLCAAIVAQLARRFGHNPNVLGWQIGNEYTDESFDPATRAQFQQFLRDKYKTLDNLNHQWSTAYWSQTYTAWSQIPMENTGENPGLLLDHKHFVTATWRSFQRVQIDVLRPAHPARAVHHHQYRRPRLVGQLGPLRDHGRPRPRERGTTTSARAIWTRRRTRCSTTSCGDGSGRISG